VLLGVALILPLPVSAQQASSIAGGVSDDTGGVLPGVTVDVASAALIEGVRTVFTDSEGRYNVTPLPPGAYSVTFTLPGFSTIIREGVELSAGFAANIDAAMQVGGIEETITVTGASPVVDVQNVRQQTVVSEELLAALPSGSKGHMDLIRMIPGMSSDRNQGGGGATGIYATNATHGASLHGKGNSKVSYDGMQTNNLAGNGAVSYVNNPSTAAETTVETGGISAESNAAGVAFNMIPKEGGNTFSSVTDFTYTNDSFQKVEITPALAARGVTRMSEVLFAYDSNYTIGGPIKRDKVWFFNAVRLSATSQAGGGGVFFNTTRGKQVGEPGYLQYTPDLNRPTVANDWLRSNATRITIQATQNNKLAFFADPQSFQTRGQGRNLAPEAQTCWRMWPQGLYQAAWTSTLSNRLLVEAGASLTKNPFPCTRENVTQTFDFTVADTDISVQEQSTGIRYNAKSSYMYQNDMDRFVERFSLSYVTGSHSAKFGVNLQQHVLDRETFINQSVDYRFNNGVPNRIQQHATPFPGHQRTKAELGIFVQDQWTLDKLTINMGIRFDYFNGYVPAQEIPATRFLGARSFDAVENVPNWTDVNPRIGISYDLFGTGQTALKASMGRYVGKQSVDFATKNDPVQTSVNKTTRSWSDANEDYIPDCDLTNFAANGECGAISNSNFGKANPNAITYDAGLINGFGVRDYFWDLTAEVQHEFSPTISMTAGYYRNWSDHFGRISGIRSDAGVADNQAIGPADFDPYCITAPSHTDLPNGGGYEVCGLYDIAPDKRGIGQIIHTRASNFDDGMSKVSDFVTISTNMRFDVGAQLGGSLDVGQTVADRCYTVDSPQQLLNCRVETPFSHQTQFKMHWSYPFPGDFVASGVFTNTSGVGYDANYRVKNADLRDSLGRDLAACGSKVGAACSATVVVPLIAPGTQNEPRVNSLDLRFSKLFNFESGMVVRANFDLYNAMNGTNILEINSSFGPSWRNGSGRAGGTQVARLFQFGGSLTF
jgi:hypothetical protein